MKVINSGDELDNINVLSVLFFSAPWCGPCKKLKPHLETMLLKKNNKSVDILYINIDEIECELIDKLNINLIPCVYVYDPELVQDAPDAPDAQNDVVQSSDIDIVKNYIKKYNITITDNLVFDDNF